MEIAKGQALEHAQTYLLHSQRTVGIAPPGFPRLTDCEVDTGPIEVYDVSGPKLFYDFPLLSNGSAVGSVRIAADTTLGHPWMSIQNHVLPDLDMAKVQAVSKADEEYPGFTVKSVNLVSFDYPRVGFLMELHDANGGKLTRVFDLEFPQNSLLGAPEGGLPKTEGLGVFSLFQTLQSAGIGENHSGIFDHANKLVAGMSTAGSHRLGAVDTGALSSDRFVAAINNALDNQPEGIGAPSEKTLTVPHEQQEKSDYCVLACIDMLLGFHVVSPPASQNEIRALLVQPPPLYSAGGILPENQLEAFKRCFPPDSFEVMIETSPIWAQARDEIDKGRPLKSGIFGHARVCSGYNEAPITTSGSDLVLERHRSLWINDPSSSQVRLELFEVETTDENNPDNPKVRKAIPIKTNYVYARPVA